MNQPLAARRRLLMLGVPALVAIGGLAAFLLGGRYVSSDNAYARALVVDVAAEVGGKALQVPVVANQHVDAGALLVGVDARDYEIAVAAREAELWVQVARVEALRPEMREVGKKLQRARDEATFAGRELARIEQLHERQLASAAALDEARHRLDMARAEVGALEQEYLRAGTGLGYDVNLPREKHPFYTGALAALEKAKLDLSRTQVAAPIDGVVANKQVNAGDLVVPGQVLMSIVQDHDLWVDANLKETELTHVAPGQPVEVTFDLHPDEVYRGEVESISAATGAEFALLPPQNASGNWVKVVQRLPVRIRLQPQPGQPALRAGLSAEVRIDTGRRRITRLLGG